jgi:Protein of unknown function (DUF1264)
MKLPRIAALFVVLAALIAVALAVPRQQAVSATMPGGPTGGYTLHIDADFHFGSPHPHEIAHHWCKTISPTLTECQLYDSDGPGAKLVGVETIVPASVWATFTPSEQALWHYHKTELKKIHATLPDTPKDKQAAIIAAISNTYGKVWILWDPMTSTNPIGQPSITVLK